MIRTCSLEEISDGRLYDENDMVKADTGNCAGCKSVCCHEMGSSIVLDPYDVFRLTETLERTFEELLADRLEINPVDGILLPNLKMTGENSRCAFLNEAHRCTIHSARPSMCRLFPLGRYWEDETHFRYILQTGQCPKSPLTKVKVKKWLDTPELAQYNTYITGWHQYIKRIEGAVAQIMAQLPAGEETPAEARQLAATQVKTICMYTLKVFYNTPYDPQADFYQQFRQRLETSYNALGLDGPA